MYKYLSCVTAYQKFLCHSNSGSETVFSEYDQISTLFSLILMVLLCMKFILAILDAIHCSWSMGKGEADKSDIFSSDDLVVIEKYPVLHLERDY